MHRISAVFLTHRYLISESKILKEIEDQNIFNLYFIAVIYLYAALDEKSSSNSMNEWLYCIYIFSNLYKMSLLWSTWRNFSRFFTPVTDEHDVLPLYDFWYLIKISNFNSFWEIVSTVWIEFSAYISLNISPLVFEI